LKCQGTSVKKFLVGEICQLVGQMNQSTPQSA